MEEQRSSSQDHFPERMINRVRLALGDKPTPVFSLRLPHSLRQKLSVMARKEGISENQFVTLALAEKIATLETSLEMEERLQQTADVGNREEIPSIEGTDRTPKEESMKPTFDEVWHRIVKHEGEVFMQKRGGRFTYAIGGKGNYILPDRTNQNIARSDFSRAYELVPLSGTTALQHLRGPSYIYAILMDDRIRQSNW
jgi:hypothetical protein